MAMAVANALRLMLRCTNPPSCDVAYTTPIFSLPVAGTEKRNQTTVNVKVMYAVRRRTTFHLVGGTRTFSILSAAQFNGPWGYRRLTSASAGPRSRASAALLPA